jgi:hypothetical protein
MNAVHLPALTADSALGFLAALGTARMLRDELDDAPRIGWPDGRYVGATLHTRFASAPQIARAIGGIAATMAANKQLLPGVNGFPPRGEGSVDPTKGLTVDDGRGLATQALDDHSLARWCQAVVGFVPPIDRKTRMPGPLEVSRFLRAGPGTVWVPRTLQKVLDVTNEATLLEAFESWRRVDGFIGAYLDHRADVDAAAGQSRKDPPKRGVPGATFLAINALPLFAPRSVDVFSSETVGWVGRRGLAKGFAWPVWSQQLELEAVECLLDHPVVVAAATEEDRPSTRDAQLMSLGISAVLRSRRIAAGNNDAALAAAELRWERVD